MAIETRALSEYLSFRKVTLYMDHHVEAAFIKGKKLVIKSNNSNSGEQYFDLDLLRRVVIIGRTKIDSIIFYNLIKRGIPIDWIDIRARPLGEILAWNDKSDHIATRQQQFSQSIDAFNIAKELILAKIDNCREIIRRKIRKPLQWDKLKKNVIVSKNISTLMGAEGFAARNYFSSWKELITDFNWEGRKYHPSSDPVNLLLSFGYTSLYNRVASAVRSCGLNPRIGILHRPRGRHCVLASDLMEPFRPIIDGLVLRLLRTGQYKQENFKIKNKRCVFADNNSFRRTLSYFEDLFCRNFTLYKKDSNERGWLPQDRSLNDHIDDLAQSFCAITQNQYNALALRIKPCRIL